MSAGSNYFPIKGLAQILMRRRVDGVPVGPYIGIFAPQSFDVDEDTTIVPVPGGDVICWEFKNFNKFSIPIEHGAIRMDQLNFFLGGEFEDDDDLATFEEHTDRNPWECELWVQSNVAQGSDASGTARYYEWYPRCSCIAWKNPRKTAEAVVFAAEFSGYAEGTLKRKMFRDVTGNGVPVPVGDTTPPTVSGSVPAHNATVTSAPTAVTVDFSEAMNEVSVKRVELVSVSTGLPVAGQSLVYEVASGPAYRVTITVPALADGDYWVVIPRTVKDEAGNFIASQQVVKFTVDVP